MKFFNFIFNLSILSARAKNIKNDPEARAKSAQFGVSSIIYSVISAVFFVLGAFLINLVLQNDSIVILVLCGLFGAACMLGSLVTLFHAVFRFALQVSINRSPVTWVALAVLIAALIGMTVGATLILM